MVTNIELEVDKIGESCSLDAVARTERFADLSEFSATALVGRERTEDAVVLIYRDGEGVEAAARKFAALERDCCPGFNIVVERRGDGIVWNVTLDPASDPAMLDGIWAISDQYFDTETETAASSDSGCGSDCGC